MYCRKCGNNLADNAKFCGKCGQVVKGNSEDNNRLTKELGSKISSTSSEVKNKNSKSKYAVGIIALLFFIIIGIIVINPGIKDSIIGVFKTDSRKEVVDGGEKEGEKVQEENSAPVVIDKQETQAPEVDYQYKALMEDIENESYQVLSAIEGYYSVAFKDLEKEGVLIINNQKSIAASVIKIYIMIEAFNQIESGWLSLTDQLMLTEAVKVKGSGTLQNEKAGSSFTIEELIDFMLIKSDNTSANMLIDLLGMEAINERIYYLGCKNTELNRKMMDQEAIDNGIENYTSVEDLSMTLTKLYNGKCISKEADAKMINVMKKNENDKKISAYLPSTAEVANKSGEYSGIENDCGIIYTGEGAYLFCVLTSEGNPNEQIGAISNLSKYIYDRYSQ